MGAAGHGDDPARVGEVGAGLVTKLVHNCAAEAMQAALAEAFVLGVKAGIRYCCGKPFARGRSGGAVRSMA